MKTSTGILTVLMAVFLAVSLTQAQQQIPFQGYVAQGEGIAGWNADGSGPEPAATGHQVPAPGFGNQYYYGSSLDYITGNENDACFHFTTGMSGFPNFEQALIDHGFSPEQVKCKYGLTSLEDDIEGLDWFFMDNWAYSNYYDIEVVLELDGEPILSGHLDWANMYINTTGGNWEVESSYFPLKNIAIPNTAHFNVAQAFLNDLNGKEIMTYYQATFGGTYINGNGRSGAYYNVINGTLSVGNPTLPFQGLYADHEGFAGWDADGSGPEPEANGHNTQFYYTASLDYDDIDPDPNACLGHFLEGSTGFFNTSLQLQYRGYEIGDLKLKVGLSSLGPDVEGEDWGNGWSNYYNNLITIELDGEPILTVLNDTNQSISMGTYWMSNASYGKVYDVSALASPEAQFVAQSFLKDMGTHFLRTNTDEIHYADVFDGNGRNGAIYEITAGAVVGIHAKATFIPEGPVSGTWTAENSPYYVDGHLTVENGETLTIEPGVKVAVRGPYHFEVQGCVKAEGTAEENIVFTRSNPNLWWDGFDYFETPAENQESVFNNCLFEYGYGLGTANGLNSGGMFAVKQFDSLAILNSTFRYNKVDRNGYYPPSGGAIGVWDADILVSKCIFYENEAEYGGAFFSYENAEPVVSNCLFYNNHAYYGGAIALYEYCNGVFINNTIADNTANYGGAFYFYLQSNPEIINTILWGNEASIGAQVYSSVNATSNPGFYYCNIEEGHEGFGGSQINGGYFANLEEDPIFTDDPELPLYSVEGGSPVIDFGTPDTSAWYYPQYLPETCLCGHPRLWGSCIDMGVYEYLFPGINEKPAKVQAIYLFPNPARQETTIYFSLQSNVWVTIELYNSTGEKVQTIINGNLQAGEHALSCQTAPLKPGIYFCTIKSGDQVITQKLMKQ